ncbi:hypothetical protein [Spongiactinospora sp. 9N601]|uniref:hypothetical protein n=1 Tax=Spongiactinospora sp. 9N601 TaxID=3375149 RepID=UPI0037A1D7BA
MTAMLYTPEENHRRQLISGLRRLAYFLEVHRDIPAPRSVDVIAFLDAQPGAPAFAQLEQVAALLESAVEHGCVAKDFGAVTYRAIAPKEELRNEPC